MPEQTAKVFPVVDPGSIEPRRAVGYPEHLRDVCTGREKRVLGDPLGLTSFGHWHSLEDEFIMVIEGEATLVSEAGEKILGPGMAAGFPKGKPDGHQLVNRGSRDVVYLEVGDRRPGDEVAYPDVDLTAIWRDGRRAFVHKNGQPY
jgi:uncharacterized cupin superfamily protein